MRLIAVTPSSLGYRDPSPNQQILHDAIDSIGVPWTIGYQVNSGNNDSPEHIEPADEHDYFDRVLPNRIRGTLPDDIADGSLCYWNYEPTTGSRLGHLYDPTRTVDIARWVEFVTRGLEVCKAVRPGVRWSIWGVPKSWGYGPRDRLREERHANLIAAGFYERMDYIDPSLYLGYRVCPPWRLPDRSAHEVHGYELVTMAAEVIRACEEIRIFHRHLEIVPMTRPVFSWGPHKHEPVDEDTNGLLHGTLSQYESVREVALWESANDADRARIAASAIRNQQGRVLTQHYRSIDTPGAH